jgi:hypothetical protein
MKKSLSIAAVALAAAASADAGGWGGAAAALGGYADGLNGRTDNREEQRTVTAIWTGEQEYVTTVTGQSAWKCGYLVYGRRFYKLFRSGCPSSIQVE